MSRGNGRLRRARSSSVGSRSYTTVDNLSSAIVRELETYSEDVTESVKVVADDVMKDLVNNTKRDAPIGARRGKYKKAISSKVSTNTKYKKILVWHVKAPHYRLAHLLNNGHVKRGGGRIAGDNHITKNERIAVEDFERKIEEIF